MRFLIHYSMLVLLVFLYMGAIADRVSAQTNPYDTRTGQLYFKGHNQDYQPALLLKTDIDADVNGMVASVMLEQTFENDSDDWLEGVYAFPLPENAAVNQMRMIIGDRIIVGEIKEKQAAKKIYSDAKKAGKRAALTEQIRPNIFSQRIANIGPKQTIKIQLGFVQTVEYNRGLFTWRLPTTVTPRYSPAGITTPLENKAATETSTEPESFVEQLTLNGAWSTNTALTNTGWPLPASLDSFLNGGRNQLSLQVKLNAGLPLAHIDSLFHEIDIQKRSGLHDIQFAKGQEEMDRDFVLQWKPVIGSEPKAVVFNETVVESSYSLLMVVPPATLAETAVLQKDTLFIIDTSGSMSGQSITQAKASLIEALDYLQDQDKFNIIEFNSQYTQLFPQTQNATQQNITHAKRWIKNLNAGGGTEMRSALNAGFDQLLTSQELKQLIFITDGAVTNESALFQDIYTRLGDAALFTVGIGSAPNSYFMKKAAEFGRGSYTFVQSHEQIKPEMSALFEKIHHAAAKSIKVDWPGQNDTYPRHIPDLYLSEPLLISVKSDHHQGAVKISGRTAHHDWQQVVDLQQPINAKGIASLWARAKIEDLEDQEIRGADPESIKQDIVSTALVHQLVSRHTSFVAVEQEIARLESTPLTKAAVQNNLPKGWHATKTIPYPSTATAAELSLWLGCFAFFGFIIVRRMKDDN